MRIQAVFPFIRFSVFAMILKLLIGDGVSSAGEREILNVPVRVVTSADNTIFPESWRKSPIHATGEPLATSEFERVSAIFKRAFAKYPEPILTKHLKAVYVLSELKYSGVVTGGTNSRTAVYVKVGDIKKGYTDMAIEDAFHAEFSSILLRNLKTDFDAIGWQKFNPSGFQYSEGDGVGAIKAGKASLRSDTMLHEIGFRNQYSQSSLENDFNGYAAALFCGDKDLWDLAMKYPKIKGKLELTLAFYQSIDPSLTKTHFRGFLPK